MSDKARHYENKYSTQIWPGTSSRAVFCSSMIHIQTSTDAGEQCGVHPNAIEPNVLYLHWIKITCSFKCDWLNRKQSLPRTRM